jgi:hypothetical protein
MRKKSILMKRIDGVSPVVGTILMVAISVVLAAILYVMSLNLVGGNSVTPMIGATKSGTNNYYVWTVDAITGGGSILKSDIYVQLKNESGFVISTEPMLTIGSVQGCNGTHGFSFVPASTGNYIGVGDSFLLDKAYTTGCTITLVTPSGSSLYGVFTV